MAFNVEAFVAREFARTSVPTKRSVKNKSGRTSRKQAYSRRTLQAVGGTLSITRAIYADADKHLCVTVPNTTGMRNGVPYREPQEHQGRYYMGRGIN